MTPEGFSDLLEPAGRVLVQEARNQRLIGQAFRERSFLDGLQVLARESNVQPPILAERGLRVASVPRSLTLPTAGGLPLATLDRVEQFFFVSVHLHRPTPHRGTASSPSDSG